MKARPLTLGRARSAMSRAWLRLSLLHDQLRERYEREPSFGLLMLRNQVDAYHAAGLAEVGAAWGTCPVALWARAERLLALASAAEALVLEVLSVPLPDWRPLETIPEDRYAI